MNTLSFNPHNSNFNSKLQDCSFGYTFVGCHIDESKAAQLRSWLAADFESVNVSSGRSRYERMQICHNFVLCSVLAYLEQNDQIDRVKKRETLLKVRQQYIGIRDVMNQVDCNEDTALSYFHAIHLILDPWKIKIKLLVSRLIDSLIQAVESWHTNALVSDQLYESLRSVLHIHNTVVSSYSVGVELEMVVATFA